MFTNQFTNLMQEALFPCSEGASGLGGGGGIWTRDLWVMSTTTQVSSVSGVPARLADQGSWAMNVTYVPGGLPRPQRLVSKFC